MRLRHAGFMLYILSYLVFFVFYFVSNDSWTLSLGILLPIIFIVLSLWSTHRNSTDSIFFQNKQLGVIMNIYAICMAIIGYIALFTSMISTHYLIFMNGISLVWIIIEFQHYKRLLRISLTSFLVIVILFSIPIPVKQTLITVAPAVYQVPGQAGSILAPNISSRHAYLFDWLNHERISNNSNIETLEDLQNSNQAIDQEMLDDYLSQLFNVPEDFYSEVSTGESDPHALMNALASWNKQADNDVTQGKVIMGMGHV